MMKSMTGFGRSSQGKKSSKGSRSVDESEVEVAIKAVNGRFLEMRVHMPREYAELESEIKAIVSSVIRRGTVDVYINRHQTQRVRRSEVNVNLDLAKKWMQAYKKLGRDLKLQSTMNAEFLLQVPDVFVVDLHTEVSESEKRTLKAKVNEAAVACDKERIREGKALQAELMRLCQSLEKLSNSMESMKSKANQELESRYRERLKKLGLDTAVDSQRLAQELIIQMDRSDVSEEMTRLREHLKVYRQLLKQSESQGKKLDFYAQELLREVNTIGSKSHMAQLTSLVVDAKAQVEKIREQVQNVE